LILKVSVRCQVGAITRRFPFVINLTYHAAPDERFETVINGGQRNTLEGFAGALPNFFYGGVVALGKEYGEYLLALAGGLEPSTVEGLFEMQALVRRQGHETYSKN
jgi:hypothetical protein